MKKMRKLIPALAMLLVSAVMMSTASFAWFSMNTTVDATGMQIKATSTGGLAIGSFTAAGTGPSSSEYYSSAEVKWTNHVATSGGTSTYNAILQPVSLDGGKWTAGSSKSANDYNENVEYSNVTPTTATAKNDYYLLSKWNIKSLDDATDTTPTGLYLDAIQVAYTKEDNANDNLMKSIRVAIKVGSSWFYFAPGYTAVPSAGLHYATFTSGKAADVSTYGATGKNTITVGTTDLNAHICSTLTKTNATTVEVYVYFEGEDESCTSVNAVSAVDYAITLTFKAAANPSGT